MREFRFNLGDRRVQGKTLLGVTFDRLRAVPSRPELMPAINGAIVGMCWADRGRTWGTPADYGHDLVLYGEHVVSALMEAGHTPAEILRAGVECLTEQRRQDPPTAAEIEETVGNSPAPVAAGI